MKVPNDRELTEHVVKVQALARKLNEPGSEMALFILLSDIERAAEKAQWRMNDLMYGRGFKFVEPMGG